MKTCKTLRHALITFENLIDDYVSRIIWKTIKHNWQLTISALSCFLDVEIRRLRWGIVCNGVLLLVEFD